MVCCSQLEYNGVNNMDLCNKISYIQGTCKLMCPASEIKRRETQRRVHKFEQIEGTEHLQRPRADKSRIVKEYSRPAAGKPDPLAQDVRPSSVLLQTTDFLLQHVCSKTHLVVPWRVVYEYVFDRLRAVRQDMVMQNVYNNHTVWVLERIVRFHMYASYVLCDAPIADFVPKINDTHIQECIKRLVNMYSCAATCQCKQEEFLGLYLLFNLGSVEALIYCLNFKIENTTTETLNLPFAIALAWWNKNCVRVLKLCNSLTVMQLCAMHRHIRSVRTELLKIMSCAYNSKTLTFPVNDLTQLLLLDDESDCHRVCTEHGLEVSETGVHFSKATFTDLNKQEFRREKWIDYKLEMCGVSLPKLLIGELCDC